MPKGMYDTMGKKQTLPLDSLHLAPNTETEVLLPLGQDGLALQATFQWIPASSLQTAQLQGRLMRAATPCGAEVSSETALLPGPAQPLLCP